MLSQCKMKVNMSTSLQMLVELLKTGTSNTAKVKKKSKLQRKWATHQAGMASTGSSHVIQVGMAMTLQEKLQILKRRPIIFTSGGTHISDTTFSGPSKLTDSKLNGPVTSSSTIQENTNSAHNLMMVQECGLITKRLLRTGVFTEEERDTELEF